PTGLVLEHRGWVEDVCFTPDGKRLATASPDDGITIWSGKTGEKLGPPLVNSGGRWQVVFDPQGTRVVATLSGRLDLWTLPPPLQVNLRDAALWVEVQTWQQMDPNGVLTWLDRPNWLARRAELEKVTAP